MGTILSSSAGLLLVLQASSLQAQVPLPYSTGFDDAAGQQGWQLYRSGVHASSSWDYEEGSCPSTPDFLWHDYVLDGTPTDTVCDWFVSPAFDFILGGRLAGLKINVNSITGAVDPGDELAVYLLVGSADPTLAANVQRLVDLTGDVSGTADWVEAPHANITPIAGECHLAIKYRATADQYTVSMDNLLVSDLRVGIDEAAEMEATLRVFPNPCTDAVTIATRADLLDASLRFRLYDARGVLALERVVRANGPLSLDVAAGAYGYVLTDGTGRFVGRGVLTVRP